MKKILHVSSSPRGTAAESYRLSRKVVECLLRGEPHSILVSRPIGSDAVPHIDEDYAVSQSLPRDVSQKGSMMESEKLIQELESADFVVIGTPMHNFTVPSVLKAWIDHVVRARRTFNITSAGKVGTVKDRPVYVAISSGGRFSGPHARQPDFLTPYLTYVLGIIGLRNLTFFSVQGTAADPGAVAQSRSQAELAIQQHFIDRSLQPGSAAHHERFLQTIPIDAA